jgi:hypothetical protein
MEIRLPDFFAAGEGPRQDVAMRNKIPFDARFWNFLPILR